MAQSLSNVLVHAVFGTYQRAWLIPPSVDRELHTLMGGVLREHGCNPVRVGGVEDHVHLLFALSRTVTIAQAIEKVKTASSGWMKDRHGISAFRWQGGYGAFSVSERARDSVVRYINRQREHHRRQTFHDEYLRLLDEHGVTYDPAYVMA